MLECFLASQVEERKAWREMMAKRKAAQERIERQIEAIAHSIWSEQDGKTQDRSENVMERQEIPKEGAAVASLECEE
jgi:hypothetical protein